MLKIRRLIRGRAAARSRVCLLLKRVHQPRYHVASHSGLESMELLVKVIQELMDFAAVVFASTAFSNKHANTQHTPNTCTQTHMLTYLHTVICTMPALPPPIYPPTHPSVLQTFIRTPLGPGDTSVMTYFLP